MLAAGAPIHAQREALSGIEHPLNELWFSVAPAVPRLKRLAAPDADDVSIGRHARAPDFRRERGSVSLSPIALPNRNRAVMVVRLPPDVRSVCPVADL